MRKWLFFMKLLTVRALPDLIYNPAVSTNIRLLVKHSTQVIWTYHVRNSMTPAPNVHFCLSLEADLLTPTLYWPMVESSLGIVGACMPLMRPIFSQTSQSLLRSFRGMLSLSSSHSRPLSKDSGHAKIAESSSGSACEAGSPPKRSQYHQDKHDL